MKSKSFYRLIEDETPILPEIAAESVVGHYYTEKKIQVTNKEENNYYYSLVSYLAKKANDVYNVNAHFNSKIKAKGNKGLDHLFMFMNHWLEGKIMDDKKRLKIHS